jgi:Raf kinase inhibitor-like YbhB/YbcL family protein
MNRFATLALMTLAATAHNAHANSFELQSNAIKQGAGIAPEHYANAFGCTGGNVMPDLSWTNAPAGTKSFAVTFYDKDAQTGSGCWHWVAYDIPVSTTSLPGGATGGTLPGGIVEGNTDMSKPGFIGPCPPPGRKHDYVYTVHALKVDKLPVDKGASSALIGVFLYQNTLAKATLRVTAGPRK